MLFTIVLLCIGIGLLIMNEVVRRYPPTAFVLFVVIPLILTPFWIIYLSGHSWFDYAKVYSVLAVTWVLLCCRFVTCIEKKWYFLLIYLLTLMNIVEAIVYATGEDRYPYINPIAGTLLIFSLPSYKKMYFDGDLHWDIPVGWILGYTLWNLTFVYCCLNRNIGVLLPVDLAPLSTLFYNRRLWFQTRAWTFAIFLILMFSLWLYGSDNLLVHLLDTGGSYNGPLATFFSAISFIWIIGYCLKTWLKLR